MPRHREADDDDLVVIALDDPEPAAGSAAATPPDANGRGPQRGRRRTRTVALIVSIAVLAAGALSTAALGHDRGTRRDARRATGRSRGALLPFATGTSLVLGAGDTLRHVDVDTGAGRTVAFPELAGSGVQVELATSHALVVRASSTDARGRADYVLPADLSASPVAIASDADTLVPAVDDRDILRVSAHGRRMDEVDARGRSRSVPGSLLTAATVVAGLPTGLAMSFDGHWVLAAQNGSILGHIHDGRMLATGGLRVVSAAPTCGTGTCTVYVTDLYTGNDDVIPEQGLGAVVDRQLARVSPDDLDPLGRVSPDGRWLALLDADDMLDVVDLYSGDVFETHVATLGLGSVAWAPDGGTLFALPSAEHRGSVAVYRPDSGDMRFLRLGARDASSLVAVPGPRRGPDPTRDQPRPTTTSTPTGPLLGGHTGLYVVGLQPSSVHLVDADTGRIADVNIPDAQLGTTSSDDSSFATIPAEPGVPPVVVGGSVVFIHSGDAIAFAPRTRRFRELGPARRVFPSNAPGRVWLVAPGPPTGTGDVVWSTDEVDVASGRTIAATMAPGEALAVTARGLVIEDQTTTGARFVVWDPSDRRIVASTDSGAAYAGTLAGRGRWFLYADPGCACVRAFDVDDGSRRTIAVAAAGAAIAPDGRNVALSTGAAAGTWTIADLDTGTVTPIPSLGLDGARPVWSPDGAWLLGASYGGGVHALGLSGGTGDRGTARVLPGLSGASWFTVAGK